MSISKLKTLLIIFGIGITFFVLSSKNFVFAINNCSDGWQVNVGETKQINCQGVCKKVTNNCSKAIFVPTRTSTEWAEFRTNHPSCVTLSDCISPPSAPSVSCSTASSSQINVSWTNVANEDGYKIYRCAGSGCTPTTQVYTVGANVTSWSNTGLSSSTTYGYRVKAYNSAGDSSWSNTAYCTTQSSGWAHCLNNTDISCNTYCQWNGYSRCDYVSLYLYDSKNSSNADRAWVYVNGVCTYTYKGGADCNTIMYDQYGSCSCCGCPGMRAATVCHCVK